MRFHYSFSKYFIHQNSSSQGHLNIQLLVCAFFALKKKKKKNVEGKNLAPLLLDEGSQIYLIIVEVAFK